MANYKKQRPWSARNRCHMCKYWKGNKCSHYLRQKFSDWRRMQKGAQDYNNL